MKRNIQKVYLQDFYKEYKKGEKMINAFIRVIILYVLVLIVMRLMGKRELRTAAAV